MPDDETSEVTLAAELIEQEHITQVCGRYDRMEQTVDVSLLQAKLEEKDLMIAELQAKLAALVEIKTPKEQPNDEVNQAQVSPSAKGEKAEEGSSADAGRGQAAEGSKEDSQPVGASAKGNRR